MAFIERCSGFASGIDSY